ncbi:MAG: hypothetical protein GF308_08440 [Candidatus Heimdallarchaeota archaeon]|nr:hypothetical protein [Candidatus Heimdallarchaeota archaeon]
MYGRMDFRLYVISALVFLFLNSSFIQLSSNPIVTQPVGATSKEPTNLLTNNMFNFNSKPQSSLPNPEIAPASIVPQESFYHHVTNFTLQYIFVGYNDDILHEDDLINRLPAVYSQIDEDDGLNFTVDYHLDYEIAYTNNNYFNSLKTYIQSNILSTYTSKLNNTALYQQHLDGQPRSIFNQQAGKGIDGLAVADWLDAHPVLPEPTQGYRFYLLNLSYLDTVDPSSEHWFEFENYDADTNELIDWFRLEWENELNPEIKFPYPGFDSPHGKTYILDPSAYKWFNNWSTVWFSGYIPTNTTSCWYNDLDDFQTTVDVTTPGGQDQLVLYLYEWLSKSYHYIFHSTIHKMHRQLELYGSVDSVSVQTLVLNADDEFGYPIEDINWVTSATRIFERLNNSLPFYDWSIDVTFANISDYPIVEQSVQNSLINSDPDFWLIDGMDLYFELENRRHQLFDLNAADRVISSTIIIRKNMTMGLYGYLNFTGLGGADNVLILKSRDRYFKPDGETPKSGITDVLIHEIGHTLGLPDNGMSGYFLGTMSYFHTLDYYNWFYKTSLRRSASEFYYCEVMANLLEDQRRFGTGLFPQSVDSLILEIYNALDQSEAAFEEMDYLEAYTHVRMAYDLYQQLALARKTNQGNRISLIGEYTEGMGETVVIKDNIAYLACGATLETLDISDPSSPAMLDRIFLDHYAMDIHIENNYAFLSRMDRGFGIIDISDPANLVELYSYDDWDVGKITDIHVSDNYAFVANNYVLEQMEGGVKIFDISNPLNPIEVNHIYEYDAVTRVTVEGSYAYLAFRDKQYDGSIVSGIAILDVSNPYAVEEKAIYYDSSQGYCFEISVQNDYLYYCDSSGRPENFLIIDISNPANPVEVGSYASEEIIIGSYIEENYAFLACRTNGLEIVQISDPTNPNKVGEFDTPCQSWDVYVQDNVAFVADIESLQIIDVASKSYPSFITDYGYIPSIANAVVLHSNYAFIADSYQGLVVVEVSDPTNPIICVNKEIAGRVFELQIQDHLVYVLSDVGLYIYDITNPSSPIFIDSYGVGSGVVGFHISENYGYLTTIDDELLILDITDPYSITLEGSCSIVNDPYTINVYDEEGYAFIAGMNEGEMCIVDISTSSTPMIAGWYNQTNVVYDIQFQGQYAYLANGESGLLVLDITNPFAPVFVGEYVIANGFACELVVEDDCVFLAASSEGIRIVNVSLPETPFEIGYTTRLNDADHLSVVNGTIVTTNTYSGLRLWTIDLDGDGLYYADEQLLGLDPTNPDSDHDGIADGEEDYDNDGVPNLEELLTGSNPLEDDISPTINSVSSPTETISADEGVEIKVNATDYNGVESVIIEYSATRTWNNITANWIEEEGLYIGTIPEQAAGSEVYYHIYVQDVADNWAVSSDFHYSVVEETTTIESSTPETGFIPLPSVSLFLVFLTIVSICSLLVRKSKKS